MGPANSLHTHGHRQRGQEGRTPPPWIFIPVHGTNIVERLKSAIFRCFLLFFSLIFRCPLPSPGRGSIVLFFGLFCYFSVFFFVASPRPPPPPPPPPPSPPHATEFRGASTYSASLTLINYSKLSCFAIFFDICCLWLLLWYFCKDNKWVLPASMFCCYYFSFIVH